VSFDTNQRRELIALARESIVSGLREHQRTSCPQHYSPTLEVHRASFVTLRMGRQLRGCTGAIRAMQPLAEDVWRNAWTTAFGDPRFPPLTFDEYPQCSIQISVLSELEPLPVTSEAELLSSLRPGIDGILFRAAAGQSTFLPAVWKQLPDPAEFVRHLKLKAGWSVNDWPADLQVYRYTTESFGESGEDEDED
jgi:AmmeMemoRadiSam system protein A